MTRLACTCWLLLATCWGVAATAAEPGWIRTLEGPGIGDEGALLDAIEVRQRIDIYHSPARTEDGAPLSYNHPGNLCETRDGTLILMWNGGYAEQQGNRVYVMRKPRGADRWSDPVRIVDRQIDFGVVYQPRRPGAPIMMGYWLRVADGPQNIGFSYDDGLTWQVEVTPPAMTEPWAEPGWTYAFNMSHPVEFPDGTLWWPSTHCSGWPNCPPEYTIVPPDNYTGSEPGGTPWSAVRFDDQSQHPGFLVLSSDYQRILLVNRKDFFRDNRGDWLTTDGGRTWNLAADLDVGSSTPGLVSLDIEGGASQGWHLMGTGRDGWLIKRSDDPVRNASWTVLGRLNRGIDSEDADGSFFQSRIDRKVHAMFTGRGETTLKYYVFDPDYLTGVKQPSGPPVVTMDPRDAITYPGRTALFSAWARGADPRTFRWQVDDGSGWRDATSAGAWPDHVFQTDLLTLADDGTRLRCVIANGQGTVTTAAATLSVIPSPVAPSLSEPVAYYPFDETSGTVARDASGNGYDLDIIAGGAGDWVQGRIGGALSFDRTAAWREYLGEFPRHHVPADEGQALEGGMTVAMWFRADSWGGRRYLLNRGDNNLNLYHENGRLHFDAEVMDEHTRDRSSVSLTASAPAAGSWHHVAMTHDGERFRLFLDGAEVAAQAARGLLPNHRFTRWPLHLGTRWNQGNGLRNESFIGRIDEVRLYNAALPAGDIRTLAAGTAVPTASRSIAAQVLQGGSPVDLAVTLSPGGATSSGTSHRFDGLGPSTTYTLDFATTVTAMLAPRPAPVAGRPRD